MKTLQLAIAALTITGFGYAAADTVNPADVTTFQSGTPALADDVNGTVQALIAAIDGNAATIAALEDRVLALETPVTLDDLIGKTYCHVEMISTLQNSIIAEGDEGRVSTGIIESTLMVTSPSQLTMTSTSDTMVELLIRDKQHNFGIPPTDDFRQTSEALLGVFTFPAESDTFVITGFSSGTISTDVADFHVSPDGNMITYAGTESDVDGSGNREDLFFGVAVLCD